MVEFRSSLIMCYIIIIYASLIGISMFVCLFVCFMSFIKTWCKIYNESRGYYYCSYKDEDDHALTSQCQCPCSTRREERKKERIDEKRKTEHRTVCLFVSWLIEIIKSQWNDETNKQEQVEIKVSLGKEKRKVFYIKTDK